MTSRPPNSCSTRTSPPATKPTITLVEHERRARRRRSRRPIATASPPAQAAGQGEADAARRRRARARSPAAWQRSTAALPASRRGWRPRRSRSRSRSPRKLAPELIAREPLAEIAALATECFRHLVATPHVVVRVGDRHLRRRQATSSKTSPQRAASRAGWWCWPRPTSRAGDCRIEWADGGVIRDRAATDAAIDEAVARYVAARGGADSALGIPGDRRDE